MKHIKIEETTLEELIKFLTREPGSRPKSIAESLGVSRQYVQKLLAANKSLFSVTGSGPNRFYRIAENTPLINTTIKRESELSDEEKKENALIEANFYSLTPLGEELIGLTGFASWCQARGLNLELKRHEYLSILNKYYPRHFTRPIDFTSKLKSTLNDSVLKKVWSIDYYNFEIFGKTKLGTQVMIAKQTGDTAITDILVDIVDTAVKKIVISNSIEAVAFVSPTIQRQTQLMSRLEANTAAGLPRVKIHKVGARILIAQKTLKSLEDRILNAEQTFIVESTMRFNNVLIIDDALGSGATLNEIARQMQKKNIAKNCYGLVLVASPSGYEVINEV